MKNQAITDLCNLKYALSSYGHHGLTSVRIALNLLIQDLQQAPDIETFLLGLHTIETKLEFFESHAFILGFMGWGVSPTGLIAKRAASFSENELRERIGTYLLEKHVGLREGT